MLISILREPVALELIVSPFEAVLLRDALAVLRPATGAALTAAATLEATLTHALDVMAQRAARAAEAAARLGGGLGVGE